MKSLAAIKNRSTDDVCASIFSIGPSPAVRAIGAQDFKLSPSIHKIDDEFLPSGLSSPQAAGDAASASLFVYFY
jgi:hypothetical protein